MADLSSASTASSFPGFTSPRLRKGAMVLGPLLAAALYTGAVLPRLHGLPEDYRLETRFQIEDRFRATAASPWERSALLGRRIDQTLLGTDEVSIVQGDVRWRDRTGQSVFESGGIYGVDRRSRANIATYGDTAREGLYLFPPKTARTRYTLWDPMFIGKRSAEFVREVRRAGLTLYQFNFQGERLDETAGYATMRDVPERYLALTDCSGMLFVEPLTGMLVDYAEQGVSYFVDPATHARLDDFHAWMASFDPATRTSMARRAVHGRRLALAATYGVPGVLVALALAGLARMLAPALARP